MRLSTIIYLPLALHGMCALGDFSANSSHDKGFVAWAALYYLLSAILDYDHYWHCPESLSLWRVPMLNVQSVGFIWMVSRQYRSQSSNTRRTRHKYELTYVFRSPKMDGQPSQVPTAS